MQSKCVFERPNRTPAPRRYLGVCALEDLHCAPAVSRGPSGRHAILSSYSHDEALSGQSMAHLLSAMVNALLPFSDCFPGRGCRRLLKAQGPPAPSMPQEHPRHSESSWCQSLPDCLGGRWLRWLLGREQARHGCSQGAAAMTSGSGGLPGGSGNRGRADLSRAAVPDGTEGGPGR